MRPSCTPPSAAGAASPGERARCSGIARQLQRHLAQRQRARRHAARRRVAASGAGGDGPTPAGCRSTSCRSGSPIRCSSRSSGPACAVHRARRADRPARVPQRRPAARHRRARAARRRLRAASRCDAGDELDRRVARADRGAARRAGAARARACFGRRATCRCACMLEGGTWAAGRELARRAARRRMPPLAVASDGTVF